MNKSPLSISSFHLNKNLTGFTPDRNDPNILYGPFDMNYMDEIYNYYFCNETLLQVVKNLRDSKVFAGDIEVSDKVKDLLDRKNQLHDDVIKILKETLDWKLMFGFCPFQMFVDYKSKKNQKKEKEEDEENSKESIDFYDGIPDIQIKIPPISTLQLILEYKIKQGEISVRALSEKKRNNFSSYYDSESFDDSITVFIWPDKTPDLHGYKFKSILPSLHREWIELQELRDILQDATRSSSRPPVFTSSKPKDPIPIEHATESRLAGDSSITDGTNVPNEYEVSTIVSSDLDRQRRMLNFDYVHPFDGKKEEEYPVIHLREGESISRHVEPKFIADYAFFCNRYEESIRMALQIPQSYLNKGASRYKSHDKIDQTTFKTVIESDRKSIKEVYAFIMSNSIKYWDNVVMIKYLSYITETRIKETMEYENNGDHSNEHKIKTKKEYDLINEMCNDIMLLILNDDRYSINFIHDSFQEEITIQEIISISDQGATEIVEAYNLLRTSIGLKKLEPNDPLVVEKKKIKDLQLKSLEMSLKNQSTENNVKKNAQEPKTKKKKVMIEED